MTRGTKLILRERKITPKHSVNSLHGARHRAPAWPEEQPGGPTLMTPCRFRYFGGGYEGPVASPIQHLFISKAQRADLFQTLAEKKKKPL